MRSTRLTRHTAGPVEEGNVGGGTGMICNEFKGGIGTSSRVVKTKEGTFTVGVLVQCNYGEREQLRIAGVNVGREIPAAKIWEEDTGSIIVVVATDAPLLPTQLKRVARRVALGVGRDGSYSGDGSGDLFIAFSTANPGAIGEKGLHQITMMPNGELDSIFPCHGASDRRSGGQCDGRGGNDDWSEQSQSDRAAA